jgi:hypothetical protein
MHDSTRETDEYDPERVLPWMLFDPPEPEQTGFRETVVAGAARRQSRFVIALMYALSAWQT